MKILDCTLRDGGYYNNWDFEEDTVNLYLDAIAESKIDYVELGLRQFDSKTFLGAHAYTTKKFLSRLNLPDGPVYGVMVDAKTILNSGLSQEQAIEKLFDDSKNEKIGLVRIAAHFHEIIEILESVELLKDKGYEVGLNMMQASEQPLKVIENLVADISKNNSLDVLYFADSLGSMDEKDINKIISAIKKHWSKPIGFHSHNNKDRALENTKVAFNSGCEWLDCTVTGMGRGAGNTQTEYIVLDESFYTKSFNKNKISNLVSNIFLPMKSHYGWGSSIEYFMGAVKSIHPTYVQEICADQTISKSQRLDIIDDLSRIDKPNSYSLNFLTAAISKLKPTSGVIRGNKCTDFLYGKEVLLIAQTESFRKYHDAINDYIDEKSPYVISINIPKKFSNIVFDAVAITHNEKFRKEIEHYEKSNYSFIAPKKLFTESNKIVENINFDYGISIKESMFEANDDHCILPSRLTFAYALAFSISSKASSFKLCGFEGYKSDDIKNKEMNSLLAILKTKNLDIKSLTPTNYDIELQSIFNI